MLKEVVDHVEKSWSDVQKGNSSTSQKIEVGAEAAALAVGVYALSKFGMSRALSSASEIDNAVVEGGEKFLLSDSVASDAQALLKHGAKLESSGLLPKTAVGLTNESALGLVDGAGSATAPGRRIAMEFNPARPAIVTASTTMADQGSAAAARLEAASEATRHMTDPEINSLVKSTADLVAAKRLGEARESIEKVVAVTKSAEQGINNVRGTFWLAQLEHQEGNLAVSERHFDNILDRTSHWRGEGGSTPRARFYEEYGSMLRTGGRISEAEVAEARVLGLRTNMPDLSTFKDPLLLPADYAPSEAATLASHKFKYDQFMKASFPDTFKDDGSIMFGNGPYFVLDRAEDPVLKQIIGHSDETFAHLKTMPDASLAALGEYTRRFFPEADTKAYFAWREKNDGQVFHFGEFPRTGVGVCNQHSVLFKTLGETQGHEIIMYNGHYGGPHAFTTALRAGEEKLWDVTVNNTNKLFEPGKDYQSPFMDGLWDPHS